MTLVVILLAAWYATVVSFGPIATTLAAITSIAAPQGTADASAIAAERASVSSTSGQ
jgi:hypothetical protein